jgi:putative transposase
MASSSPDEARSELGCNPVRSLTDRTEDIPDGRCVQSEDIPDSGFHALEGDGSMKERVKFVLEWERRWKAGAGRLNFAELCREFGISRQVGYRPQLELPAQSTIGEVLRRRGLILQHRRRVRVTKASTQPFADVTGPNATWCADFKGNFRTQDGSKCHPLTIIDAYSRFLIRCEGVENPDGREVQRVFDSAFQEFGLPAAIRSDNGPPFASVGAGGLTKLSVWWLRLGIRLERIEPGKPQQNGRQERFHRTLKAETAKPPRAHQRAQQRAFDCFRREYNEERPHEALGQRPPSSAFALSPRRYPRPLVRFSLDAPWNDVVRVDRDGFVRWHDKRVFISSALAHEDIELRYEPDSEQWHVVFGPLSLGWIRETPTLSFFSTKGRMADQVERELFDKVSGMSSD